MPKHKKRHHQTLVNSQTAEVHHRLHLTQIINQQPIDKDKVEAIAHLGFINNAIRRRVWPVLLGYSADQFGNIIANDEKNPLPDDFFSIDRNNYPQAQLISSDPYYSQVEKDIARSLNHFDCCKEMKIKQKEAKRKELGDIIHTILAIHSNLHYIQGYHDIVSVILLIFEDPYNSYLITERLSLLHIRDYLRPNLDTVIITLNLLFPLIQLMDQEIYSYLISSGVQSFFSLSWVLTWFAHNFSEFNIVARIFDFLLANHPIMPIYLIAALIKQLKTQILLLPCELTELHKFFQELSDAAVDVPSLLIQAKHLFNQFPAVRLFSLVRSKIPIDSPLRCHSSQQLILTKHFIQANNLIITGKLKNRKLLREAEIGGGTRKSAKKGELIHYKPYDSSDMINTDHKPIARNAIALSLSLALPLIAATVYSFF
jgi:hypothetical protein